MKHAMILCAVFLFCGALLVLREEAVQRLLGLRTPSRLWARLIGAMGIVWVLLAVLIDDRLGLLDPSIQAVAILRFVRYHVAGILIGLIIALNTKRKEGLGK